MASYASVVEIDSVSAPASATASTSNPSKRAKKPKMADSESKTRDVHKINADAKPEAGHEAEAHFSSEECLIPDDSVAIPIPTPRTVSDSKLERKARGKGELKIGAGVGPDPFLISSKDIQQLDSEINPRKAKSKTGAQKRRSRSLDNLLRGDEYESNEFDAPVAYQRTMSDCVPSPSSDSSYASSSGSNSSDSSSSPTCEISLLERLIRTHPVWFLPSLQRSGALHLLQGREVGNFIVRSSTQPMTMAVSVKLPGNHVEHYLLRAIDNRIALENSTNTFETVHQLIAHYCTLSDEIPVFLRVPSAIAEATTRQQLRSLALLGQEFWTHSALGGSCAKDLSSPSDADLSNKNLISSGLGSQSSLSQNSLCGDLKKPCRPTTLELGTFVVGNVAVTNPSFTGSNNGTTPPPVPPRWSRSALLTPLSLPSSVQSTPSEIQSTFSEKSGSRLGGKKKKRISGNGKAESIHYKDTEILDLFKGTKTLYDDKASDYEDIWSPQQQQQYSSKSHTPVGPPRLSTFRPDIIASSLGSDLDTLYKHQVNNPATTPNSNGNFQQQILLSLSKNNLNNNVVERRKNLTKAQNNKNNRLSFNGNFLTSQQSQQFETFSTIKTNKSTSPLLLRSGTEKSSCSTSSSASSGSSSKQTKTSETTATRAAPKIKNSLYSEPVDSIAIRRFGNYRHSEPNIRWSQPAMMSLMNVDDEFEENETSMMNSPMQENATGEGSTNTNSASNNNKSKGYHPLRSSTDVSGNSNNVNANLAQETGSHPKAQNTATVNTAASTTTSETDKRGLAATRASHQKTSTCVNVDNLCHFRDFKKKARKFSCSGGNMESEDEEEEDQLPVENVPFVAPRTNEKSPATPTESRQDSVNTNTAQNSGTFVNITGKPKPAPRKRSLENTSSADKSKPLSPHDERAKLEVSNNQSWHLDNSWEFVMWEKGEEENSVAQQQRKFPVSLNPLSLNNANMNPVPAERHALYRSDECLNNNGTAYSLNSTHRFSRYDNLESREECEDDGSQNEGDLSDLERDEKISAPWDSSKWENLLRLVSESTQQLDSLQVSDSENKNAYHDDVFRERSPRDRESKVLMDSKHRISKILEVNTNVDKASRAISNVVRELSEKEYGFFGPTLKSFIQCTIAAKIQDPFKVMRNTRQFISGMKNYLVGVSVESQDLRLEIKRQTELLSDCEFLNIDAILEEVLVDMVISPLNTHILGLLQTRYSGRDDSLRLSKRDGGENFSTMSTSSGSTQERMKSDDGVEKLRKIYFGFEESVSPIKKLDRWNEFVCEVQEMENYSSESFLPLLADMLRQVCSSNLPSHVDYMIGLLPHSLAEQNNYSISLLQSAVAALKSRLDRKGSSTLVSVRVIIPDERNGTLIRKMVPIRETTTTKEVSKMVASKIGIANPGDYVLVRIKNGEEKLCPEGDLVAQFVEDSQTALAYKRVDAKIGWPQKIT